MDTVISFLIIPSGFKMKIPKNADEIKNLNKKIQSFISKKQQCELEKVYEFILNNMEKFHERFQLRILNSIRLCIDSGLIHMKKYYPLIKNSYKKMNDAQESVFRPAYYYFILEIYTKLALEYKIDFANQVLKETEDDLSEIILNALFQIIKSASENNIEKRLQYLKNLEINGEIPLAKTRPIILYKFAKSVSDLLSARTMRYFEVDTIFSDLIKEMVLNGISLNDNKVSNLTLDDHVILASDNLDQISINKCENILVKQPSLEDLSNELENIRNKSEEKVDFENCQSILNSIISLDKCENSSEIEAFFRINSDSLLWMLYCLSSKLKKSKRGSFNAYYAVSYRVLNSLDTNDRSIKLSLEILSILDHLIYSIDFKSLEDAKVSSIGARVNLFSLMVEKGTIEIFEQKIMTENLSKLAEILFRLAFEIDYDCIAIPSRAAFYNIIHFSNCEALKTLWKNTPKAYKNIAKLSLKRHQLYLDTNSLKTKSIDSSTHLKKAMKVPKQFEEIYCPEIGAAIHYPDYSYDGEFV
ncbi:MAG: hypothetical protein MHPSP_001187 [Paramarteilia canceri]